MPDYRTKWVPDDKHWYDNPIHRRRRRNDRLTTTLAIAVGILLTSLWISTWWATTGPEGPCVDILQFTELDELHWNERTGNWTYKGAYVGWSNDYKDRCIQAREFGP